MQQQGIDPQHLLTGIQIGMYNNLPASPPVNQRRCRRLLWFIADAMRVQPLLSVLLFFLVIISGLFLLSMQSPGWRVSCGIFVPDTQQITPPTFYPDRNTLSVPILDVNSSDITQLLSSTNTIQNVENSLGTFYGTDQTADQTDFSHDFDSAYSAEAGILSGRNWQDKTNAAILYIAGRIGRVFGIENNSTPHKGNFNTKLAVKTINNSTQTDENVIHLELWAGNPRLAEEAALLLVDEVRNDLSRICRERVGKKLQVQVPKLDEYKLQLAMAESELNTFREANGKLDPAAYASQIENSLAAIRVDLANIATQQAETKSQRLGNLAKLKEHNQRQTDSITVSDNPRVIELKEQISDLNAQYVSLSTQLTAKHPDMLALRNKIETKQREMDRQEQTIISETVTNPNPIFSSLLAQQLELDQKLSLLAGREIGLVESERQLSNDLAEATSISLQYDKLNQNYDKALLKWSSTDQEVHWLNSIMEDENLFADFKPATIPRVADINQPDYPNPILYMAITLVLALIVSIIVPAIRMSIKSRLVSSWQIEELGHLFPVQVAGELPLISSRRLLQLPGRRVL